MKHFIKHDHVCSLQQLYEIVLQQFPLINEQRSPRGPQPAGSRAMSEPGFLVPTPHILHVFAAAPSPLKPNKLFHDTVGLGSSFSTVL